MATKRKKASSEHGDSPPDKKGTVPCVPAGLPSEARRAKAGKPSPLLDTRVIYCGDNLVQLAKWPDACVDLIYIDPPFNSNRNYEVFWGETREKRSFEDRHASTLRRAFFRGRRSSVMSCV